MSTSFRYTRVPGTDNKEAMPSRENLTPTYAASIALAPSAERTKVWIALTGALALTASGASSYKGDEMDVIFSADGSARTVTPGSGISGLSAATIVCAASKTAQIALVFDGTNWVEKSRTVQA